jgi:hypothetical protein
MAIEGSFDRAGASIRESAKDMVMERGGYGREETRLKSESMGDIMWNGRKKVKGRISEA